VIKHPLTLNAQTHANLREVLREKYKELESDSSKGYMFLDEGMDITFPPIKLVDAQFLELGKFNQSQICGMFGVPLMLVQAGDNPTTFASATEFKRNFVDLTIAPIAVNFENAVDRDCLILKDQTDYFTKFNVNSLLRGNITERFAAYQVGVNTEILNPNQCRELEDLNPYEGGDEYRTRTSTIKESDKIKEDPKKGEE
jgi:HK97 family phage portal protein